MGSKLNIIKTSMLAGCLAMSACATVDMTDMSGSQSETTAKSVDVNVVQRAASRLYSAFTNRGFVEKTSRNKMRSAARMLLKGLEKTPLSREVNYAASVESLEVIKSDIVYAQSYVDQTRQAAEIYLAMAPGETSLKEELSSLQKALAAANEAKNSFSDALEAKQADTSQDEFVAYVESVTALSKATDAFGVRVRAMSMGTETPSIG